MSCSDTHLEEELAQALTSRDLHAVVSLAWALYAGSLLLYLDRMGLSEEEAEDVLQEALARVVEQWESYEDHNFEAWLFGIVRFVGMKSRTEARRATRRQLPARRWLEITPEDLVSWRRSLAACQAFRETVGPVDRAILDALLRPISDRELSEELEAALGTRLTTVALRSRRRRLRESLRSALSLRKTDE